jgi:hypothetical protein
LNPAQPAIFAVYHDATAIYARSLRGRPKYVVFISTMKFAALASALLLGSASAFAPSTTTPSHAVTQLNAERSASMPFMNKPKLVRANVVGFVVGTTSLTVVELVAVVV